MENPISTRSQTLPAPPRRRLSKWVVVILLLCTLVLFAPLLRSVAYALLGEIFPDSPPPDDRHLVFTTISVPNEDNAFYDLDLASSTLPKGKDETSELRSSHVLDRERARAVLASHVVARGHFREASLRKYYLVPAHGDPRNISLEMEYPILSRFRVAARAVDLDARVQYESGNIEASIERAFELIRLGSLMEASPRPHILDYMVGTSIKRLGLERMAVIVADPLVDMLVRERVARDIEAYRDDGKGLAEAFRFEYVFRKKVLADSWNNDGQPVNNYLLRPNTYTQYDVEHTDWLIARIDVPCAQFASTTEARFVSERAPSWWGVTKALIVPNGVGKALFYASLTNYDTLFARRCEAEAMIDRLANLEN
jgi:hypothetical protein